MTIYEWMLVLTWPIGIYTALLLDMADKQRVFGIGAIVLLGLFSIHWPGILPYVYSGPVAYDQPMVWRGFELSTMAFVALWIGIQASRGFAPKVPDRLPSLSEAFDPRLAPTLFFISMLTFFGLLNALKFLPGLSAIEGVLQRLGVVAIMLMVWRALNTGDRRMLTVSLVLLALAPVASLIGSGFLGFGVGMVVPAMIIYIIHGRRPITALILLGPAVFLGLSIFTTYFKERGVIREAVWGGQELIERAEVTAEAFATFQWLDLSDPLDRHALDGRLNQNHLVGASMDYVSAGFINPVNGRTIIDAVLAIIPRAIWPDKPFYAGSGQLATEFTGIQFAEGTSVGIGMVLELYVNFGVLGTAIGMLLFGLAFALLDRIAVLAARSGNSRTLLLCLLVALSINNPGGSFAESAGAVAAALVLSFALFYVIDQFRATRRPRPVAELQPHS